MQLHGDYVVGRCNQVVLFAGKGPWNDETLYQGTKMLGEQISQVDMTQPWAQFSCLFGESLMPPSAFKLFAKQTKIRKERGLSALAIVIQDSDIKSTIKHQLTEAYTQADIEHAFFDDSSLALDWLKERQFVLDDKTLATFLHDCEFIR